MTQLSPDTSIFDQVAVGLTEIISKKNQGKYITKEQILEDFNKLLNNAYRNLNTAVGEIELIAKGEPPSSEKMNRFFSDLKNNINITAKQLDYLLAKTISIFNLFNTEIENEKNYSKRIFSKTKILQMYSRSPAEDIVYNGDTFDNQDYVDFSKISQFENPIIESGSMGIQIVSSRRWNPNLVKINKSNGVPGNNLMAIRKLDQATGETYSYAFKDKASLANMNTLFDSNPVTYFEYEIFNVDRQTPNNSSTSEFCYIVDSEIIEDAAKNSLFNWSDHDLKTPLVFDFTMTSSMEALTNSIKITPYFGGSKKVKVTHIYVTDKKGTTEDVLSQPIYIGSALDNLYNSQEANYFLNSATIRYPERNTIDINIVFEQDEYESVDILHSYWTTDYSSSNNDNSPFFGSVRFNPDSLNRDIYQEVLYDKQQIIPPITNPIIFSNNEILKKDISISVKKRTGSNTAETTESYKVPIKLEREILKANRMSIGIRDISVEHVSLAQSAEMISLPYFFDKPVESLMLSIESDASIVSQNASLISSEVSVDQGKSWIKINPTQFGFNSSQNTTNPEVLVFNQNVAPGYRLPGVEYYNYPDIPQKINSVIVKINIQKDIVNNMSPLIYSYMLAAKVSISWTYQQSKKEDF